MLRKVHILNLGWCKDINDISSLKNMHTLTLSSCESITDVASLTVIGCVNRLNLNGCSSMNAVTLLQQTTSKVKEDQKKRRR
eukprot:m.35590 g.35590  ORF g.35590 m.35590 type:complete len:82 (-) comp6614_c0_seq1:12-257(-)